MYDHLNLTLTTRATDLRRAILRLRDGVLVEHTADPLDAIDGINERDMTGRQMTLLAAELRKVEAALERMKCGEYGICDCGEPISPARLRAVPWAVRCVVCQEAVDRWGEAA